MVRTSLSVAVTIVAVAALWGWTASQFANRSVHQNDALQRILCYLERRTLVSKTVPINQKVKSLHTLDQIDRVGHLAPCTNLPKIRK